MRVVPTEGMVGTGVVDEILPGPDAARWLDHSRESLTHPTARTHDARRTYRRITGGLVVSDALSVALALLLVEVFLYGSVQMFHGINHAIVLTLLPIGWVTVFALFGLYAPTHLSAVEEFRRVVGASSVGMVGIVLVGFASATQIPRSLLGILWALSLTLELLTRRMWRLEIVRRRTEGSLAMSTLVLGTNQEAVDLAEQLSDKGSGYRPRGFVAVASSSVIPTHLDVVGGIYGLLDTIRSNGIECLFVASSALRSDEMLQVLQVARLAGVEVRISAQLPEILSSRVAIQNVGTSMALAVRPLQLSRTQALAKRLFDVVVAGLGLILASPLLATIAVAIRLTSDGPALFRQTRVTKDGTCFEMIKFRTMQASSEELVDSDPSAPFFKPEHDPRITKVGDFLRRTSLDELPQLVHVLRGQMSLVGPRPLPVEQVSAHPEFLNGRLEVQAGMTGWWQIRGRSDVDPEAAVRLDVFYIENWSLSLDLYILLKTLDVVMSRLGAR